MQTINRNGALYAQSISVQFFLARRVDVIESIVLSAIPVNLSGSIGGGLSLPHSSNMRADLLHSVYDYPLGQNGYDLNGKIRIGLPVIPFSIIGTISYNSLSDDFDLAVYANNAVVNSKYTYALSVIGVGLGVEYTILSTPVIKPYVGASEVMNFIRGSSKSSVENVVLPQATMNSTSRLGLDLGIGTLIDIPVLPFSLDLEAKYRLANLFGKTFDSMGYSYFRYGGLPQTPTYNLNDSKNPNDPNDHARSLDYFTITLGLNFKIL